MGSRIYLEMIQGEDVLVRDIVTKFGDEHLNIGWMVVVTFTTKTLVPTTYVKSKT